MADFIKIPRSFLDSPIIDNAGAFRLCCYLYAHADENGRIEFSSGDAWRRFRITPRQFRTTVNLLSATDAATIKTTNKTTSISFCDTDIYNGKLKAKRQAKRTAERQTVTPISSSVATSNGTRNFDFVDPVFKDAFFTWIDYKETELRERYKTERTLKAAYNELVELSGRNPYIAMRIVEQSMANRWKGLFELKKKYGTAKESYTVDGRKIDQYSELEDAAEAILRHSAPHYPYGNDKG